MPGYAEPVEGLPPDDVLVARLRAGDDHVFALLLDHWSGSMLRLARSFVSTEASAAEVVQETWLAVIEGVDGFEGRSSVKTWVYRILTNTAKRRGTREHRVLPWSDVVPESGPTVDPSRFHDRGDAYAGHWVQFPAAWPLPEQGLLGGEVRALLAAALARLPDRQRVVITLRDVEGYGSAEVCELLGISAANQRVLLHRARAFLRGRLEEYYTGEAKEDS